MGFDLHTHSRCSDGNSTPEELIREATAKELEGIALTDHDTVAGIAAAAAEAEHTGFRFIPGIELTTDFGTKEAHILGYGFDWRHPGLTRKLETIIAAREERAKQIIARLNKRLIPLDWETVKSCATGGFIGRPHIFKAMELKGYIDRDHRDEYFNYYLGQDGGVAYVPHLEIETEEAVELINEVGGIPVLAHPGRIGSEEFLRELIGFGLKGLEVYYPAHSPEQTAHFRELAEKLGLYATGGSDYHGKPGRAELGAAQVPALPWEKN